MPIIDYKHPSTKLKVCKGILYGSVWLCQLVFKLLLCSQNQEKICLHYNVGALRRLLTCCAKVFLVCTTHLLGIKHWITKLNQIFHIGHESPSTPLMRVVNIWCIYKVSLVVTLIKSNKQEEISHQDPTFQYIMAFNRLHPKSTLMDFTLSNAKRFYSSKGDPSGLKGLKTISLNP